MFDERNNKLILKENGAGSFFCTGCVIIIRD